MPIDQRFRGEIDRLPGESGQSIVLVALAFVGLLGAVALAIDVGLAFVRSAQFTAAVDAASLAAVVDMDPQATDTAAADVRAEQFLGANGWPVETLSDMRSARSLDALGIPNYTLTVTWPVEFYFARVLGFESTELTRSATAAHYSQAEMLTTSAAESGHVRKASQFIYGPEACTFLGDPIVPEQSTVGVPNPNHGLYEEVYRYRISVTEAYTLADRLRIELFDPDSYNNRGNSALVVHSSAVERADETMDCSTTTAGMGDRCVLATGESLAAVNQNPIWLQRVDENWKPDCTRDAG
ncbi:MAG: pilus assembly protein TadG-related protein, partial [Candidatus Promineifilaceae bacterium]|nr:pilus assembly protein TadG-related protein [Candidatus Promineifilaceae bacterium]